MTGEGSAEEKAELLGPLRALAPIKVRADSCSCWKRRTVFHAGSAEQTLPLERGFCLVGYVWRLQVSVLPITPPAFSHRQDTVGAASWQETQATHAPAIAGLLAAFPEHYESWAGGHLKAEQVGASCL